MPNWCSNGLIVKGKESDLNAFKSDLEGEDTWLDFEKVVSTKASKDSVKEAWEQLGAEQQKERWNDDFHQFWFNNGGYDFQANNWGTKWNSDCEEPLYHNGTLSYGFQTAWSPSLEITRILIEKYPHLEFEHTYDECGMMFMGKMTGEDGEVTLDECYDIDGGDCPKCQDWVTKRVDEKEFECDNCKHRFTHDDLEE